MPHMFQSKMLVDSLSKHGFCCSYREIKTFEKSGAMEQNTNVVGSMNEGSFLQYSTDNVDHNICSIDGYGTFHEMGIVCMATPAEKRLLVIPRVKITSDGIVNVGRIPIQNFYQSSDSIH